MFFSRFNKIEISPNSDLRLNAICLNLSVPGLFCFWFHFVLPLKMLLWQKLFDFYENPFYYNWAKLHVISSLSVSIKVRNCTSNIMRKPVYATCEQQRRRSACTSVQSDQHLWYSLPWSYNISSFCIQTFKPLVSFCGWGGRFGSYLVENPEDRFSHEEARMYFWILTKLGAH